MVVGIFKFKGGEEFICLDDIKQLQPCWNAESPAISKVMIASEDESFGGAGKNPECMLLESGIPQLKFSGPSAILIKLH